MHILKRTVTMLMVLATAALFVVACGDDDESTSTKDDKPAATETDAAMEDDASDDATAESDKTIVDLAVENPDLSTLAELVTAAGLIDTLSGEGPFTVFAPTNDAFAKLPAATIADLKKPANKDKLAAILTYHVVPSAVMSTDLTDGQKVTMVSEQDATIKLDGDTAMINDATIVAADVKASNGVVHVIDTVLMPPAT